MTKATTHMKNLIKLLIVEDELAIRHMIKLAMGNENFTIMEAGTSQEAKQHCQDSAPDLIVLDWMLPCQSGYEFMAWVREHPDFCSIPIIMLTAKAEEQSKIKALSHGADDYMTKPFSPLELIARIKSILRRGPIAASSSILRHGDLALHIEQRTVKIHMTTLDLTAIQFSLLNFFMSKPNKPFTRDQLITSIWGSNCYIDERTIDVQIKRLRDKLRPHNYHHCIKTIHGYGYQFNGDPI